MIVQEASNANRPLPLLAAMPEPVPATERPLLQTKFYIPAPGATLLSRPRLTDQLSVQPNGYLTLLSAPAGFGKTTLISDWVRQQNEATAWLTLDEQDNDPILFWRYLVTALQAIAPQIGRRAMAALELPERTNLTAVVTMLCNDIVSAISEQTPLLLVLDDYHWIHSGDIHQSLTYLIQRQPPQLHLVLLTRADPPLSLARLRVQGRLQELRANDLRLTPAEISTFLTEVMALELSPEAVETLAGQTEGWPAGLQLAALSLRKLSSAVADRFVQTLAGVRQHIFAYLMEEVLRRQPEAVRLFLRQTAILPRFCASLCTAVTGQSEAAHILKRLVDDNLFITSLDEAGDWFRYHPLFAEALRAELDETAQQLLHRRATQWYMAQGLVNDGLRHALAAQEYELAATWLSQNYQSYLLRGELMTLQQLLAMIPADYQRPELLLAAAWAGIYTGHEPDWKQMAAAIQALPGEAAAGVTSPGAALQGEMLVAQAVYTSLYGQPAAAIRLVDEGLPLVAAGNTLAQAAAFQALGNAHRELGDLPGALAAYEQAIEQFDKLGNVFMMQIPLYRTAQIQILQGRLHQALHTYELVRQRAQAAGHESLITTGEIFGHLSDLYREWNDLAQARAYALEEIKLAQMGHFLLPLVKGYLMLSATAQAQGDDETAETALQQAQAAAVQCHSVPILEQVAWHQAHYDLQQGRLEAAACWADNYAEKRTAVEPALPPLFALPADLLLARVRLAQEQPREAGELLHSVRRQAEAMGCRRLVVEAALLCALQYEAQHEHALARRFLAQALDLAEPEGYIRVFVENAPALMPLLAGMRPHYPEYITRLLAALGSVQATTTGYSPALFDALTEREQEILALIAQGYSNREIAEALVISVGTVKGHINHILSKFDAQSRTQALARARALGLNV